MLVPGSVTRSDHGIPCSATTGAPVWFGICSWGCENPKAGPNITQATITPIHFLIPYPCVTCFITFPSYLKFCQAPSIVFFRFLYFCWINFSKSVSFGRPLPRLKSQSTRILFKWRSVMRKGSWSFSSFLSPRNWLSLGFLSISLILFLLT